ncbi:MAG: nucleotidyltransferase family protein [Candidatus Omnitrophica bacterium]|nr:nucleotidyltransferase family protein [Candidatus Omnitrophota bacterium]MBU4473476.1 nucleotidyltransferase family protein [Candidatus Omnitrophota bacterium]MCG2706931.1 nucleotidyltransferase family protein [Candidatus Omnitrophota bacterium]
MVRIETIKKTLEKHKQELKATYKVKDIGIFGSYVRREAKKKSDIDILVEFEDAIDFFDFLELEEHLSKILNIKVDLVMKRVLKPAIGESIMREVIYV